MKKVLVLTIMLLGVTSFAQNKNAKASLEVDGVCLMCKERIEKASVKTKGVKSAVWDVKTHELKNIVAVGHDTKELKATDEAYNSVHPCCKYRDEDVKKDHENETKTKTKN